MVSVAKINNFNVFYPVIAKFKIMSKFKNVYKKIYVYNVNLSIFTFVF